MIQTMEKHMLSSVLKKLLMMLFQKSIQAWLLVEDLFTAAKVCLRFQNLQELLLGTCHYKILKLVQNSEKSRRRLYRPHIVLSRTQSSMTWPWTGCFFEQSKRKKFEILHQHHKNAREGFASIGSKAAKAGK